MKSARAAIIRGGAASVERALAEARREIDPAMRDPRWLPPPPPLALFLAAENDGGGASSSSASPPAPATTTAPGTHAPPADEAEAYKVWEAPVRRLRLAREACTALGIGAGRRLSGWGGEEAEDEGDGNGGVPLPLAARVYEASADAAAAMRCADGELLKALAGLCGSIYPALRRQQALEAGGEGPPSPSSSPSVLAREAEMRAALVLFYACMPARPLAQNLAQCLSSQPAPYWEQEEDGEEDAGPTMPPPPSPHERSLVRTALRGASAALSGDWVAFGSCYARMPRLPRHVMARCLPRLRRAALRSMARAFAPSLPVACCERWLGLRVVAPDGDRHAPLVALLEQGAADGCRGCGAALAAREVARRQRADAAWGEAEGGDSWEDRAVEEDDWFVDVVFKPPPPASAAAPVAQKQTR